MRRLGELAKLRIAPGRGDSATFWVETDAMHNYAVMKHMYAAKACRWGGFAHCHGRLCKGMRNPYRHYASAPPNAPEYLCSIATPTTNPERRHPSPPLLVGSPVARPPSDAAFQIRRRDRVKGPTRRCLDYSVLGRAGRPFVLAGEEPGRTR